MNGKAKRIAFDVLQPRRKQTETSNEGPRL